MYWKEVDPQNLPQSEVLAINLRSPDALDYQEKGLGYLSYDLGRVWCHNKFGEITLISCTHYIEIDKISMSGKFEIKKRKPLQVDTNLMLD